MAKPTRSFDFVELLDPRTWTSEQRKETHDDPGVESDQSCESPKQDSKTKKC